MDEKYVDGAVNGTAWLSNRMAGVMYRFDQQIIDRSVNGIGVLHQRISELARWFDENCVDFIVTGSAGLFGLAGNKIRKMQTGYLPNYSAILFFSLFLILITVAIVLRF